MYTYVNTSFEKTYRITTHSWLCVSGSLPHPLTCSLQKAPWASINT